MLNHINNALDIIPLIDNDGVKLGMFCRGNDNKYRFVRQISSNKKVGKINLEILKKDIENELLEVFKIVQEEKNVEKKLDKLAEVFVKYSNKYKKGGEKYERKS